MRLIQVRDEITPSEALLLRYYDDIPKDVVDKDESGTEQSNPGMLWGKLDDESGCCILNLITDHN